MSQRYILVGWDDKTRDFRTPFDASYDQNRLEQILNVYTTPTPEVRLRTVDHPEGRGTVAVVEIRRDPARAPLPNGP